MAIDQGTPLPPAPAPDWELPEVRQVDIRSANFRPHKNRNFASPLKSVKNAIQIVVTFDAPMPVRAMGPVLYVGDAELIESEAVDKEGKQIRFWGFEREKLADGAPISVGWMGSPSQEKRRKTKFAFKKPK